MSSYQKREFEALVQVAALAQSLAAKLAPRPKQAIR